MSGAEWKGSGERFCKFLPGAMSVCVCVCGHVYVVYKDTNVYNDMGMT